MRWADVRRAYVGGAGVHVAIRGWSCPFEELASLLPPGGDVLDIGCGSGHLTLLLAAQDPARRVHGVDVDRRKLDRAEEARTRLEASGRVLGATDFTTIDPSWRATGSHRAVVMVDALYLVDPDDRRAVVHAAARTLDPGGVLVVKELDTDRRVRLAAVRASEAIMTRLTGITASSGAPITFPAPDVITSWMAEAGLEVERVPLRHGRVAAHLAVVGHAPP